MERDPELRVGGRIAERRRHHSHNLPVNSAGFVGAYLSLLHGDPERGPEFLTMIQQSGGDFSDGLMDAPYVLRNLYSKVLQPRLRSSTPAYRKQQVTTCVLNVFEGWCENSSYVTAEFPTRGAVIRKFNPVLEHMVKTFEREAAARKVARRERQAAERAVRRAQHDFPLQIGA